RLSACAGNLRRVHRDCFPALPLLWPRQYRPALSVGDDRRCAPIGTRGLGIACDRQHARVRLFLRAAAAQLRCAGHAISFCAWRDAEIADAREQRTAVLYAMSRELAVATDAQAMATAAVRHICDVFHSTAV